MTEVSTTERLTYTVKEVAQMMGLSERTVRRLALNGDLPTIRPGVAYLFPRRRLEAFINGELIGPFDEPVESARRLG